MKNAMLCCTVLGFSVLGLGALNAQSTATLKAEVPFNFSVGDKMMPAGECQVNTGVAAHTIAVHCAQGTAIFRMGNPREAKDRTAPARLIFHRYGDRYYLSQVWGPGGQEGIELLPSVHEKELQKTASVRLSTVILASR